MKKLMLVAALAATACGADDQLIDTGPTPTTTDAPTTTTAQPTTTVEVTTTTTEPEPEPVTTVPYVAPVTTRAPRTTTTVPYEAVPSPQGRSTRQGSGACGGDLPPCSVMRAESGGDPSALGYGQCSGGRTCQGKWQIDPVTAQSVGYPPNLADQPESVQDAAARAILARDGCAAWSTC